MKEIQDAMKNAPIQLPEPGVTFTESRALIIPPSLVEAAAQAGGLHLSLTLGPAPGASGDALAGLHDRLHRVEQAQEMGNMVRAQIGRRVDQALGLGERTANTLEQVSAELREGVEQAQRMVDQFAADADHNQEGIEQNVCVISSLEATRAETQSELSRTRARLAELEAVRVCGHDTGYGYGCTSLVKDAVKPGFHCGNCTDGACPHEAARQAAEADEAL